LLGSAEYTHVRRQGYLEVASPSYPDRVYRIPRQGGFAWVFERGRPVEWLCVQPTEPLPLDDVLIMHKLLIEGAEQTYLTVANHIPRGRWNDPLIRGLANLPPPWAQPGDHAADAAPRRKAEPR
jgi:hypothetical protein